MPKFNGWASMAAIGSLLLASKAAPTQDATSDPQVIAYNAEAARLSAETALINAQKANIAAKYGEPPTTPQGSISNLDNFTALGQWAHGTAVGDMGTVVLNDIAPAISGKCNGKTIFVTSVADGRPAHVAASAIFEQLKELTLRLKRSAKATTTRSVAGTAAVVKGVAGTLESIVALFRSDYGIVNIATTADDFALRMKIANMLASKNIPWTNIRVDGLNRTPADTLPVMAAYLDFDAARNDAINRNKDEKDAASKAELATIIAEADAFDKAITAEPTSTGGQSPLVTAALALENPTATACVLFASYSIATSAITRKKLFSRNDHVTAVTGGFLKMAVFDTSGALLVADMIPVRSKLSQDLKNLEISEGDLHPSASEP